MGREDRIVEDDCLGLASEELDLQFILPRPRIHAGLTVAERVEPAATLRMMSQPVMAQGQEHPVLEHAADFNYSGESVLSGVASQTRAVQSMPPVARRCPSGLRTRPRTPAACPRRVKTSWPVARS